VCSSDLEIYIKIGNYIKECRDTGKAPRPSALFDLLPSETGEVNIFLNAGYRGEQAVYNDCKDYLAVNSLIARKIELSLQCDETHDLLEKNRLVREIVAVDAERLKLKNKSNTFR
jgi:hypothetical protein